MQSTDIMIHFRSDLSTQQQTDIEEKLRQFDGVIAPRFNKEHLLVVYYNSKKTTSLLINNFIYSIGYKTHLVGM
ncbi:MAG: hypothetical protein LC437_02730 [Thiohalomonas sp.]|nr:hypothetical protein [Thiohalomonas sp.]